MSPLEERYRRLLRVLPEPARSRWADEMTGTYLESTCADDPEYAEFGSPSPADRLDVWRLALRLRLGGPGTSAQAELTGAVVARVALLGVGCTAVPAALGLLSRLLRPDLPWTTGWTTVLGTAATVGSVALFGCLVHGARVARPLAAGLLVLQAVASAGSGATPFAVAVVGLAAAVPLVAALVRAPQRVARPELWWSAAVAAAGSTAGLPVLALVLGLPVWPTWEAVGASLLAVVGLAAAVRGATALAGAVAVLAAVALPPLVLSAVAGGPAAYTASQAGAGALLAGSGLACAVVAVRAVRRTARV